MTGRRLDRNIKDKLPAVHLDKQFVLDELPEKIDHEQHAALLEKFGLDPGKLAEKAAERGISSL